MTSWSPATSSSRTDDFGRPIDGEEPVLYVQNGLDRDHGENLLLATGWLMLMGLAIGLATWAVLQRGAAGTWAARQAPLLAVAVATPFLVLPMIMAGTAPGIAAGYLIPAAASLLVGLAVVGRHPDRAGARRPSSARSWSPRSPSLPSAAT